MALRSAPVDPLEVAVNAALLVQFEDELRAARRAALEPHQRPPDGDWTYWLLMAGRGSGKTYAGASWLNERAEEGEGCRLAVVAPTLNDAIETCIEGPSGLKAINPGVRFLQPHTLIWPSGARGRIFGTFKPEDIERFRGPEFNYTWGDEVAIWRMLQQALQQIRTGLRRGSHPRAVFTTTPKPRPEVIGLMGRTDTITTDAATMDNPHLEPEVKAALYEEYGDTELGLQELEGKLLEDSPDAVIPLSWLYEAIEREPRRDGTICAGLDVARFGKDHNALVVTVDSTVLAMEEWKGADLMETVGRTLHYIKEHGIQCLAIDDTGAGGGVTDRLVELMGEGPSPLDDDPTTPQYLLVPINFSRSASDSVRFHNKPSEMWWRVRETADPTAPMPLTLPGSHPLTQRLIMQLGGARRAWDSSGHGRIWVDKGGGGRFGGRDVGESPSPDLADALCLALEAWSVYWARGSSAGKRETVHFRESFLTR